MAKAWRDLRSLRQPDRFDAWLHRLLVHAFLRRAAAAQVAADQGGDRPHPRRRRPGSHRRPRIEMPSSAPMRGLNVDLRAIVVLVYSSTRHCPRRRTPSASRSAPRSPGCTGRAMSSARRSGQKIDGTDDAARGGQGVNAQDPFDRRLSELLADASPATVPDYLGAVRARRASSVSGPHRPRAQLGAVRASRVAGGGGPSGVGCPRGAAHRRARGCGDCRLTAPGSGSIRSRRERACRLRRWCPNRGALQPGEPTARTLSSGSATETRPSVSLDGRRVAFLRERGTERSLVVADVDGSAARSWSPWTRAPAR